MSVRGIGVLPEPGDGAMARPHDTITPIFLLSLPRSGSTLVQRVLASYPEIATAAEPWLLLPLLSPVEPIPPMASGWQRTISGALHDFGSQLPGGEEDYLAAVREAALRLYARSAPEGARYFLDKTPPYHHIIDQLIRTFPRARFVILWRNPLSVLASVVETLCDGAWDTQRHRGDLFHGISNLVSASARHGDRIHAVRYEDLLLDGGTSWRKLAAHLDIPFEEASLTRFQNVELRGRMGDPTGVHSYNAISCDPLDKWRATICNPVRVAWSERYLRWIGRERLAIMGYDMDALLSELRRTETSGKHVPEDIKQVTASVAREIVRHRLAGDRLTSVWRSLLSPLPR
jgi:sulfotransferase family protein